MACLILSPVAVVGSYSNALLGKCHGMPLLSHSRPPSDYLPHHPQFPETTPWVKTTCFDDGSRQGLRLCGGAVLCTWAAYLGTSTGLMAMGARPGTYSSQGSPVLLRLELSSRNTYTHSLCLANCISVSKMPLNYNAACLISIHAILLILFSLHSSTCFVAVRLWLGSANVRLPRPLLLRASEYAPSFLVHDHPPPLPSLKLCFSFEPSCVLNEPKSLLHPIGNGKGKGAHPPPPSQTRVSMRSTPF